MLKRCLLTVLLCGATAASFATTISLKGSAGAGWAALTWTVANGGVNAQEVYRDTDADPSGRVRIASLAASARSYTDAAVTTGRTYGYWIKARESTDNAAFDSNAVALIPSGGSSFHRKISRNGSYHWEPLPAVSSPGLSWQRSYVPADDGIDVWASDVKHYNGRVWMYYAGSTFGSKTSLIGLLSADSLAADSSTSPASTCCKAAAPCSIAAISVGSARVARTSPAPTPSLDTPMTRPTMVHRSS